MTRQSRQRAQLRLAVGDLRDLRDFLGNPARRGGLKAMQRRRFHATVQALRGIESSATSNIAVIPHRVARNVLWCLAQVPRFLESKRGFIDEVLERK